MKKPPLALVLLVLASFATPILCGQISLDVSAFQPGVANVVAAVFGTQDLPSMSHLVVGLLVVGSALAALLGRRVLQVPNQRFSSTLLIFLGILLASVLSSIMKVQSLQALGEWLLCGIATFAVVASAGRGRGPTAIVGAIFMGTVILARNGILEYRSHAVTDPTWRIFATWQQPNALAGILLVGVILGVGLALTQGKVWAPISALLTLVVAYAFWHTQSKGGLLALAAGLGLLAVLLLIDKVKPAALPWIGRLALGVIVLANFAAIVLTKMPNASDQPILAESSQGGSSVLGRFAQAGQTADQSVGFRKLLFASSVDLVKTDPVGSGLGTFQAVSSKPGLTTPTHLAHNTLLQLAVEASPFASLFLLGVVFFWFELTLRDSSKLPWKTNALRMSVVAAVGAMFLNGVTESNLYTFGLCLVLFLLLGVGLLLSADAVSPEFAPKKGRYLTVSLVALVALQLAQTAGSELLQAEFKYQLQTGDGEAAQATIGQLKWIDGNDGETWYLATNVASSPAEAKESLRKAADLQPLPRNFRALASAQAADRETAEAIGSLDQALRLDPNNMLAMLAKMRLQASNEQTENAVATAKVLLAVESTTYFRIRALPDIIPTETYEARIFMAQYEPDKSKRATLLQQAVTGLTEYLQKTWPTVNDATKDDPNGSFAGITRSSALAKLREGADAAHELAAVYRELGRAPAAAAAEAAEGAFAAALGGNR